MDNVVQVKVTGDASGAEAAMAKSVVAVSSGVTTMKESFAALTNVFSSLQSKMLLVAGVLAGGKAFKESIDKVVELSKEATQLSNALGISADEAGVLNTALGNVFLDKDTYIGATKQITKQLNSNATAFAQMGIATKDAQGQLLPMSSIIANTASSLQQYQAGTERNVMANQLLGRSYEDVLKLAKLTPQVMQEAAQEVADYHKQLDPAAVLRYRQAMENVGDVIEGVQVAIGTALMPVLSQLGEWLSAIGPSIVGAFIAVLDTFTFAFKTLWSIVKVVWDVLAQAFSSIAEGLEIAFGKSSLTTVQFFTNCLTVVKLAFLAVEFAVVQFVEAVKFYLDLASTILFAFADTAKHALTLDFSGAKKAWQNGLGEIAGVVQAHTAKMAGITEQYAGKANELIMPSALGGAPSGGAGAPKGGSKKSFTIDKKDPAKETGTRTSAWAMELDNEKATYQLKNNLKKLDIANEVSYWEQRLTMTAKGSKEQNEVIKKLNDSKLKQALETFEREQELSQIGIERARSAANSMLAIDQDNARAQLDLGNISNEQYLVQLQSFEDRRYEIAKAAAEQRLQLNANDPSANPAERARILAEIEAIDAEHGRKNNELQIQTVKEQSKLFEELSGTMSSLWDKGIEAMMNGTLRWSNAYRAVLASVGKVFLQFAMQKAKAWLQTEVLQTVYTRAQGAVRSLLEKAGLMQSVSATATAATTKVGANAVVAGSGAASAMAGIPYIGPILAIAAMAAMIASVGGLKGSIKSARGGYDIPAGINPMVQLHEQEMVLPKAQANAVRDMAEGGGSGGGGGTVNLHVHALDAGSVKKLFMDNSQHIGEAVKKQFRNGGGIK